MSIRVVQLGTARQKNEGLRIGTVRRPPRGVPREKHASLDFYDAWLPELAPSSSLIEQYKAQPDTPRSWQTFMRRYAKEMEMPPAARILTLLALLSHTADFSVGCYCEQEARCHRSMLRELLKKHGALMANA